MDRTERFALFVAALDAAQPESSGESARKLLDETMNQIENAHSGAPFNPDAWMVDGRMYPPQDDSERKSDIPGAQMFVSRRHRIYFGESGAIRITGRYASDRGNIILDKAGANGSSLPKAT
jgi:hypothetical protein